MIFSAIALDLPAAEPGSAGCTAPGSARPIVGVPASSDGAGTSAIGSATVSMFAKDMRNRGSKRHERKDGDLVRVSKGSGQRWSHDSPKENAFC
jgi:hypothetical protein